MAFYIRDSQEAERLVPSVSVVIIDPEEMIQSCLSPALSYESEQHPGHAHLLDLWIYSASHPLQLNEWRRRQK